MKTGKPFTIIVLTSFLFACSSTKEKAQIKDNLEAKNLYELPQKADYEKAARLNIELGLNYLKQQQISRAKTKLLHAKKIAPKLPEVHYAYGYFLEKVGQDDDAKASYEKAISLNSALGQAHHAYAAFLCRNGKYAAAEKEFMLAVADPAFNQTAEAYENAGICVLENKEQDKAVMYFEKALRYDPNRSNALLELAFVRLKQGDKAQARLYFERFKKIATPNTRSNQLAKMLALA